MGHSEWPMGTLQESAKRKRGGSVLAGVRQSVGRASQRQPKGSGVSGVGAAIVIWYGVGMDHGAKWGGAGRHEVLNHHQDHQEVQAHGKK